MDIPGANTSTQGPWLEKYARSSPRVEAPTVTAFSAAAGELLHASLLSLPYATISTTTSIKANRQHTSCNSKVNAAIDSTVQSLVQSFGLATTKGHVGNRALVRCLARLLKLVCGSLGLSHSLLNGPYNTGHDVAHRTAAVAAEHLDSNDMCRLGDTVCTRGNGSRTVCTVAVSVNIFIVQWNSLAPMCTTFEFGVINVNTGVDDVDIDALAALRIVLVLGEGTEGKFGAMADPCKTLHVSS